MSHMFSLPLNCKQLTDVPVPVNTHALPEHLCLQLVFGMKYETFDQSMAHSVHICKCSQEL